MLMEKIQLEDDERVLKQVRKHWFILFVQLFGTVVLVILPLFAYTFVDGIEIGEVVIDTTGYGDMLLFGYLVWLLFMWMAMFNIWTDYYLDVWTVTTKRLIAVDQKGLFNRSVGSFRLERLQDMNVEIKGVIATLLNFGTIEAQTAAGSEEEFRAHGLPDPRGLKAVILHAADDIIRSYEESPSSSDGV